MKRGCRAGLFGLLFVPLAAMAQVPGTQSPSAAPPDTGGSALAPASPASPRASLQRFLELSRERRYHAAANYLDVPPDLADQRESLARELKAVLDRHLWVDLDGVSGLASGDTADALPAGVEALGTITLADAAPAPVRMVRGEIDGEPGWRFTRATVQRIPGWYATLGDRWILENLPPALLRMGPWEVMWWQWIALPFFVALAGLVGWMASHLLRALLRRTTARTTADWDDTLVSRIGGPLTAACTVATIGLAMPVLGLYEPASNAAYRILKGAFLIVIFWGLWRAVDIIRSVIERTLVGRQSRALMPVAGRLAKAVVVAMAIVTLLAMFGFPVASLVAGLGLGGLALALAAQKTVENLFGAFSIGIDRPFREGDFVKIEEFVGTVEAIGLRSTRFRTLDRTIITIPNGKLAEMRLESFTARDRMRLATVIGLVYETTAAQLREVLTGFEEVLRSHPRIWPDAMVIKFKEFGASSLDIEVMAWFQTSEWSEFQGFRQEVLVGFMEVVERAGTSIAFPTRTLHVASLPPLPPFAEREPGPSPSA